MDRFRDSVEEQLQEAMERGEFDHLPGSGRPLNLGDASPDWWARRKLDEIRRQDRLIDEVRALEELRDDLWRMPDPGSVRRGVEQLNARIEELNRQVRPDERLPLLDTEEAVATWRRMARLRPR
ncbi:MAG: DnaJ family domain-containing protein [Actinomycetota bacterium]